MNPKFYSGMTSSKYASDTRTITALHVLECAKNL